MSRAYSGPAGSSAAEDQQSRIDTGRGSRTETDDIEENGNPPELGNIPIIPEIRKCSLAQFKNHFNAAKNGIYAVDVLESDESLDQEVQEELKLRRSAPKKLSRNRKIDEPTSKHNVVVSRRDSKIVTRIRIQAPILLSFLSKIRNERWEHQPRTFLRPFRTLVDFHSQVCERLRELEVKSDQQSEASQTPASTDQDGEEEVRFSGDDAETMAQVRAYVNFMSEEIIPLYHRFENLDETSKAKVRFDDLWCLFRVGETAIRPPGTGSAREIDDDGIGNRLWRIYGIRPGMPNYLLGNFGHQDYLAENAETACKVDCYYIDFKGDEFCAVTETFEIQPYEGERLVSSLKIFPQRFLSSNHQDMLKDIAIAAKSFVRNLEGRHAYYNWWTLIRDPRGEPTTDADGNVLKRPEYIDSEVIVDFVEAFQACPSWKPVPSILKPVEPTSSSTFDDFHTCWWSDEDRTTLLAETHEILVLGSGVTSRERNKNLIEDRFLATVRENDISKTMTTANYLRECDLPLLPTRQFAYVLRDRKFVQVFDTRLKPVKASNDSFHCLKIKDTHKDLIQSLVEDHFLRKTMDKKDGVERRNLDWIKGKGKGLFILLHGVPGVGKTATAEAVAQASGKPLFAITCGDLGLTPMEVESALQRIFRLANTWDCVLLLDEVDTFFSQRSKSNSDLNKSALVSVFLRVLEYYDGLLFLTTNRVGTLDEAFRSRIHLSLYYPALDQQQTMDIWKLNIDRLREVEKERCQNLGHNPLQINEQEILRFAKDKFGQDPKESRWNGRQIRNAFQIASSIAHFDARKDDIRPHLSVNHFRMIHSVTDEFDRYMRETQGKSEAQMAFDRGDRADHHNVGAAKADGSGGNIYAATPLSPPVPSAMGQWGSQIRRRPVSPNPNAFQPTPQGPFQPPPHSGRAPAIAFNRAPQPSLLDGERNSHRGFNEQPSEVGYGGREEEYFSPDGYEFGAKSDSWKRGREFSDPDIPRWSKRRRESDQENLLSP